MDSDASKLGHLSDVAVILVLGIAYVVLLSLGTLVGYVRRRVGSAAATGRAFLGRFGVRTRSAR
ncbi:hypothetical protein [Halosimplex salinum]|uniref:hypothetical protein n=1 Tax=Halosimplex salinum TaxID=1710538 RepID=UPI000F4AC179|nr:hypothetical protein [Halosimplex salinum]